MPRYFFDFANGNPHTDDIGEELSDDWAAWREALKITREVEDTLAPGGRWFLEVRRDADPVFRIEINTQWFETNRPDEATVEPEQRSRLGL
jgi:hypothetical protein